MKKHIALICLVLLAAVAGPGSAQVAKSGAARMAGPAASMVEVKIVDEKGMAIRPESLPKDVQAKLARVRTAAESLASPATGDAAAQKVKVTVSCSYPPFQCTITIAF